MQRPSQRFHTLVLLAAIGCRPTAETTTPPASAPTPTAHVSAELTSAEIAAIVDAPDRDADDRTADVRRKPAEMLAFLHLHRGMRVADIGAGFGYTTELLARAVGPDGRVWGQNPRFVLERFAEAGWSKRLAKPINANVTRVDREFGDPLPADARELDLVVNVLFYHDFEWMKIDRAAHDAAVFAALRPGGRYVIIDASAAPGAGASVSQSLHRIEESLVVDELQRAGFVLAEHGEFLRNPNDTRDWNALPWAGGPDQPPREDFSDKFVLAFEKPATGATQASGSQ